MSLNEFRNKISDEISSTSCEFDLIEENFAIPTVCCKACSLLVDPKANKFCS
jgi:hypothetical protein